MKGANELRLLGVVAQLFPNREHVGVHRPGRNSGPVAPDPLQQRVAAENEPFVVDEKLQQRSSRLANGSSHRVVNGHVVGPNSTLMSP